MRNRCPTLRSGLAAVGVLSVAVVVPLWAHHAFSAEFDAKKPITLKGTLTRMDWVNPHSWIHVEVKGPDGKVVSWMVEGGAPNSLIRRGFTKHSVEVGAEVTVNGYRAKDGGNRANGIDITFADGRKMFISSPGTGAPTDDPPAGR